MKTAWQSDIGKVRTRNEDFILADADRGIFLLADGMGGHPGGDIASALAVRAAYGLLLERIDYCGEEGVQRLLAEALAAAHAAVRMRVIEEPSLDGMGTTLDIVFLRGGSAWISHVGDSRLYLLHRGVLTQVTTDDNLAAVLAQQGVAADDIPAAARHVLTQAVGNSRDLLPEIRHLEMGHGDLLLMCSDGLTGMVPDGVIAQTLTASRDDLGKSAALLVSEANSRGGQDNISVILIAPQFVQQEPAPPLKTDPACRQ